MCTLQLFLILLIILYIATRSKHPIPYNKVTYIKAMVSNIVNSHINFTWKLVDSHTYEILTGTKISSGSYTSIPINQHKSSWCGCCYMVATMQMIQDRVHVKLGKQNTDSRMFPWVIFDLQSMLDHYQAYKAPFTHGWNACKGGLPLHLLNAIESKDCPLIFQEKDPKWLGHPQILKHARETNMKISIKNSKRIIPTADVGKRILENGPVILSISGKLLKEIDENGFVTSKKILKPDHAVSVIGWIYKNGVKHWIARNSWGGKEVPESIPKDMSCVTTTENTCKIKMESWVGDPQQPGFVYIPATYELLNDEQDSPWFEADILIDP